MKLYAIVAMAVALGACGPGGEIDSPDLGSEGFGSAGVESKEQGLSSCPAYGTFKYEGSYPEHTPCKYHLPPVAGGATRSAYLRGWGHITLKYYFSDRCGSFARIENAPTGRCTVYLGRSADRGRTWALVSEPVDPGIDFAYTKVANNLDGRLSAAALICDSNVLAWTNWY